MSESLEAAIRDIGRRLEGGAFKSEDQVSKGVVMRLLQRLDWDVFDPARVSSEFRIESRRVDYALLHDPFGPVALIEVKDVGRVTAKGEDQLFDYCSKQGVPLAVLTDGRTWSFYLPAGIGSYEQRRFAVTNLVTDDESETARNLRRYLGFDEVVSGQSHRDAQHDYEMHRRQIVARRQFSEVLASLVAEADPRVVGLFRDEVEKRCGIRPGDGEVRSFLRTALGSAVAEPGTVLGWGQPSRPRKKTRRAAPPEPGGGEVPPSGTPGVSSFTLFGSTVSCRNDLEVLVGVLKRLGERDPGLYERLVEPFAGRKRRYLSRDRHRIYPEGSADGTLRSVEELSGGWWVGTHSSSRVKDDQLKKIREVAGLPPTQFHWRLKGKAG